MELRLNNAVRQRDEELESLRLAKESADDQVALLTTQLEELSEELKTVSQPGPSSPHFFVSILIAPVLVFECQAEDKRTV